VFGFWDWVGGRFSVHSAVGVLPLSLHFGFAAVRRFLDGAHAMDVHFRATPLEDNLPVLLGLFGLWNSSFLGHASRAVLPYSQALLRFPAHLQQVPSPASKRQAGSKYYSRLEHKEFDAVAPITPGHPPPVSHHQPLHVCRWTWSRTASAWAWTGRCCPSRQGRLYSASPAPTASTPSTRFGGWMTWLLPGSVAVLSWRDCTFQKWRQPNSDPSYVACLCASQLMHQGRVIPAEFIGVCASQRPVHGAGEPVSSHDELMSNFFAQPDALAAGQTLEQVGPVSAYFFEDLQILSPPVIFLGAGA